MVDVESVAALASDVELSNFSDPRLRARLATVTRKLAANPALSFPKVFSSAELEGAYRLFGNPRVTTEGILSGHFERTRGSCDREPSTLVIHDTSTFSFAPDGAREGLGRVRRKGQAFFAHVSFPDRQLGDYEGLINALAVFAPIACRLLALRSYAQHDPLTPASSVLEDDEIQVLRVLGRIPLPAAPSARDVLLAVASLGGHIKWSGEPGWLTIGRGYAELELLTRGWRAAKLQRDCDQR